MHWYMKYRNMSNHGSMPVSVAYATTDIDSTTTATTTDSDENDEYEDIPKRILVAIIVDHEHTEHMEDILNSTLKDYVSDIVYLRNGAKQPSMYDLLHHLSTHHLTQYNLIYILHSSTVINGRNLQLYTNSVPLSAQVYIGKKSPHNTLCDPAAGVLMSMEVAWMFIRTMTKCASERSSHEQHCLEQHLQLQCQEHFQDLPYQAVKYDNSGIDVDDVIAVYGVTDDNMRKKLIRNVMLYYQKMIEKDLETLEANLTSFVRSLKHDLKQYWPPGSNKKFESRDRFDRDVFSNFNRTHLLNRDDYDPYTVLGKDATEDNAKVLTACKLSPDKFTSGWKKLDATRGVDYIIEASTTK